MLPSVFITNYRHFRDFAIEALGRINLISGANGIGKTAVLTWLEEQHPGAILCADVQRPPLAQLITRYEFLIPSRRQEFIEAFRPLAPSCVNANGNLSPQLAGGMARALEILLAVIEAEALALVDEIENGLHHASFGVLWSAIDRLSTAHQVQVFATTHSADCLRAAADCFGTRPVEVFRYHRLDRDSTGQMQAVTYTPFGFRAALDNGFEVR